jgi:histone deacetylase complex regulatory component SIN3
MSVSLDTGSPADYPILNDALVYLDSIRSAFPAKPAIYNTFLSIMKDCKKGSVNTSRVMTLVLDLFHGETALVNGFNAFLPEGHKFQIDPHSDSHTVRIITPDGIIHTSSAGAKRKQLDELDNRESDSIENGIDLVDQRKKRQKKPRRGSILADSDKP